MHTSGAGVGTWTFSKKILLALVAAGVGSGAFLKASDDPFNGYSSYSNSYFLSYTNGTSFAPDNKEDVKVQVGVNGKLFAVDVDTGSRGFYISSQALGSGLSFTNSYPGQIDLDSSGRLMQGVWTQTALSFSVTDQQSRAATQVTSVANILVVQTLTAQAGRSARYGICTNVAGYDGTVKLDSGKSLKVRVDSDGAYVKLKAGQQLSYSNNISGLIKNVSNFGIGFDLNGAGGGTGPVTNNQNQIYNPLLNLADMKGGSVAAGYIIKTNGIQLGFTAQDKGYAYTTLNPTGFSSSNSVPDWQTPMGETTVNGKKNGPGSVVMDSGIKEAFISSHDLDDADTNTVAISVSLMNSQGAAGYNINMSNRDNRLNPDYVKPVTPGTNGIYSQNQPPYQENFFNTGRNVFKAFDMLYDAENGYMGVITNGYGATDPNVFFHAQEGGFVNPIPEGSSVAMVAMGLAVILQTMGFLRGRKKGAETNLS